MSELVLDVETTIFQKGNPFSRRNRLCYVGLLSQGRIDIFTSSIFSEVGLASAELLVGFNIKFDLHWLQRTGISFQNTKIWDCQFAHFLLTAQRTSYPSLNEVCKFYEIEGKLDSVHDYWKKGIDTPDIPREIVEDYLRQDLVATREVYHRQAEAFKKDARLYNLFKLNMEDLLVLQEMEYNGLKINTEECEKQEQQAKERLETIDRHLQERCPNTPINWDSGDDVSAYLYGGTIVVDRKELAGVFGSGAKIGQPRYRWVEDVYPLVRLVVPLEGSELKKADKEKGTGPWSVSEDVLKQLKQVAEVKLLQERGKLTKLLDYLSGFPELIKTKDWTPGTLHGQFNQCVARTGRLSSSAPNLQNMPDQMLKLIETCH